MYVYCQILKKGSFCKGKVHQIFIIIYGVPLYIYYDKFDARKVFTKSTNSAQLFTHKSGHNSGLGASNKKLLQILTMEVGGGGNIH